MSHKTSSTDSGPGPYEAPREGPKPEAGEEETFSALVARVAAGAFSVLPTVVLVVVAVSEPAVLMRPFASLILASTGFGITSAAIARRMPRVAGILYLIGLLLLALGVGGSVLEGVLPG